MRTQKKVQIVSRGVFGITGEQVTKCLEDKLETMLGSVCSNASDRVLNHAGGARIEVDTFVDNVRTSYHLFDKQLLMAAPKKP